MPSTAEKCSICSKALDKKHNKVTTKCGHTFHRVCAQNRLDKHKKANCQVCRQKLALADALNEDATATPRATIGRDSDQTKTTEDVSCLTLSMILGGKVRFTCLSDRWQKINISGKNAYHLKSIILKMKIVLKKPKAALEPCCTKI